MTAMISSIVPAAGNASMLPPGSKAARLCRDARNLVAEADEMVLRKDINTAFEYYYRAALRIGAAQVALSPIAGRKRKPQGVWEQLKLVDGLAAQWAKTFDGYSLMRRKATAFASYQVPAADLEEFRDLVQQFLVQTEFGETPDPLHPLADLPNVA